MQESDKSYDEIHQSHYGSRLDNLILMLSNEDGLARRRAREALVEMGTEAVEPLKNALHHSEERVRWEAAKALQGIRSPDAAPDLVRALEDERNGIRWIAATALASLGTPALIHLLRALVNITTSPTLYESAHFVLKEQAEADPALPLEPVIRAIEGSDSPTTVPVASHEALMKIDEKPE